MTTRADDWRSHGGYFSWRPAQGDASPVAIFHVEMGDPRAPVLLLVHGWPTSSIDWFEVAGQLSGRFRVCALDFPGYGFSDKPQGWGYSLARDEELIEFYLSEMIGAEAAVIVAHDRGDSVALVHAARCAGGRAATRPGHLVLTNGSIFLPLSNPTQAQRHMPGARSWSQIAAAVTPSALAEGLGATTFTPPSQAGDPEVQALKAGSSRVGRKLVLVTEIGSAPNTCAYSSQHPSELLRTQIIQFCAISGIAHQPPDDQTRGNPAIDR